MKAEKMTPDGIIIDSELTPEQAIRQNPKYPAPQEVLDQQVLLTVQYFSFDGKLHQGQIVVNKKVAKDVEDAFELIRKIRFPIGKVVPASAYDFDDEALPRDNITSAFNYRNIAKWNKISNHAYGFAIDINTGINPYIRDDYEQLPGLKYDPSAPGAITADGPIVAFFKERGWGWGGDYNDRKDWQHFEKPSA